MTGQIDGDPDLDGAPLRVLVVDDNEDVRHLLSLMLQQLGHRADHATDGAEALELLSATDYDVMLLDLSMPGMSGEDVLRRLSEEPPAPGLRVVVVSAYAGALVETLQELGASAVLSKPLDKAELRKVLSGASPTG